MTNTWSAYRLAVAIVSMGLAAAAPSFSQTTGALSLSDGSGNSVAVTASGAICTGSCVTTSFTLLPGNIVWSGTIGVFTVAGVSGNTKPVLPVPNLDVAIGNLTTGAAGGTLTIKWSDTGFYGSAPAYMTAFTTFSLGSGTATYNSYADDTNSLFGQGISIGSFTSTGGSSFVAGGGPTVQPFSMTEVEKIQLAPNTSFDNDDALQASPGAPLTLACPAGSGQVGVSYSSAVKVTGGQPPYSYALTLGSLPGGLSLNMTTGLISGIPTQAGNPAFSITATDSSGVAGSNSITSSCGINITAVNPPSLTLACPGSTATAGVAYNSNLVASGGKQPYTFTVVSGSLPKCFSLNSKNGSITGTPTTVGTSTFTVKVVDSTKPTLSATNTCSIAVNSAQSASIDSNDTATIGFWHNQNGQALIRQLNGGGTSTVLGATLASYLPNLFGPASGNDLTKATNTTVANLFLTFFSAGGQKTKAQVMAGALAVYVTNSTLAGGTYALQYGFDVTAAGNTQAKTWNVGTNGAAIGLTNNQSYTVFALLQQANLKGPSWTSSVANALNSIFSGINQAGDIN